VLWGGMLKAYVGVASKHGLSVFQPERDDTLSLVRRCVRQEIRRLGFWAYLHDNEARSIQSLFLDGHRKEAMIALDRCAKAIGPILPGDPDRSSVH
jgi:hypothetical protein